MNQRFNLIRFSAGIASFFLGMSWADAACTDSAVRFSELLFNPSAGQVQFVELENAGTSGVQVQGFTLVSEANSYSIPINLTEPMTPQDRVLILFDGLSDASNDLSFVGDHKVVLHAPGGTFLGNPSGYLALLRVAGARSRDLLLDYVVWGQPGTLPLVKLAVERNIISSEQSFIPVVNDANAVAGPVSPVLENHALVKTGERWVPFPLVDGRADKTRLKAPLLYLPSNGQGMDQSPKMMQWTEHAETEGFELEVASDAAFTTIVTTKSLPVDSSRYLPDFDLPRGKYWWKVRTKKGSVASPWSETFRFEVTPELNIDAETVPAPPPPQALPPPDAAADPTLSGQILDRRSGNGVKGATVELMNGAVVVATATSDASGSYSLSAPVGNYTARVSRTHFTFTRTSGFAVNLNASKVFNVTAVGDSKSLGVTPRGAQKDTALLQTKSGTAGSGGKVMCETTVTTRDQVWDQPHGRPHPEDGALESWYCWAVSAVMIGGYRGGDVTIDETVYHVKDLAYGSDCGAYPADEKKALRFTLQCSESALNYTTTKWTEAQIVTAIDADQPVFYVQPSHVVTLAGYQYRTDSAGDPVLKGYFINLDNKGTAGYEDYASKSFWRGAIPDLGLTGRSKDPTVSIDTDGDGLKDFDEANRFGTLSNSNDTDSDLLPDKQEIQSWVFPRGGETGGVLSSSVVFVVSDVDGDGLQPQNDEDSDNGGLKDGEEDNNRDGVFDKPVAGTLPKDGESDMYLKTDDLVLDLVFCIDTTGSMGPSIASVKAEAIAITNSVEQQYKSFRMAVVQYRDHPPEDNMPYAVVSPFTTSKASIVSAINSLSVDGGGDTPESLNTALIRCASATGLFDGDGIGWRGKKGDGIKRVVIYKTDAPGHATDLVTGYTSADVAAAFSAGGTTRQPGGVPPPAESGGVMAFGAPPPEELSGPLSLYPVVVGGSSSALSYSQALAALLGSSVVQPGSGQTAGQLILALIREIATKPSAILFVRDDTGATSGHLGKTNLTGDLSQSVDPQGCGIVFYEWDWNGDGVYDEMTPLPTATHVYTGGGFGGNLKARITTVSGERDVAAFVETAVPSTLPVIQPGDAGTITLNRQTGLFLQRVVLTNTNGVQSTSFRVEVAGVPSAQVYNRSGVAANGNAFIQIDSPILPGQQIVAYIEYWIPTRIAPTPTFTITAGEAIAPLAPVGAPFTVDRIVHLGVGNGVMLEFPTTPGVQYGVQYSNDMTTWNAAGTPVTAGGTRTQWIDNGPPKTPTPPAGSGTRFYRVLRY